MCAFTYKISVPIFGSNNDKTWLQQQQQSVRVCDNDDDDVVEPMTFRQMLFDNIAHFNFLIFTIY